VTTEALWLDGNAIAGLLAELLGTEMTTVPRTCASCGARNAVGAHRLYRGAGLVLRCPVCADVALRIADGPGRHVVQLTGTWTLELAARY
jgi:uncharacterized protein DUF6510